MDPDEVTWITDTVAITNYVSAHSREVLAGHNVKAVLCLDRELEGCPAAGRGVASIRVAHLVDGANELSLFKAAVAALESLTQMHGRVVVHHRAGRSRSIAVVAAYLTRLLGIGADEALDRVRSKRPSAVAPELIRLVEQVEP